VSQPLRVAWLLPGVNGPLEACLRALDEQGDELLVVYPESMRDAFESVRDTAWDPAQYFGYAERFGWQDAPDTDELIHRLEDFRPDAVVTASWAWPKAYRTAVKAQPDGVLTVLAMDNIWRGSVRQWLGRLVHRFYIDPLFDCVVVPGDRSEWFARRLGFGADDVIRGFYTADTPLFDRGPRDGTELVASRSFLFVGRLVTQKAVDVMGAAYRRYRELTEEPWDLQVVGMGPMETELAGIPGVVLHGFLLPPDVADLMHRVSAFVLPSRAEPYGIVVHEAAAAGLPMLVSDTVGAAPGLVQDGGNGWVVAAGDSEQWAAAMARMSSGGADRLQEMSALSHALSLRLSPRTWARNLHEEIARRLPADRTTR
jgi:glycosyltransferase involved in cell wall biosynthesis